VNEAALLATRRGAEAVGMNDFTAAIERIVAGLEKKSRVLSAEERKIVSHHEMGHALVAMALPGTDPVHKISIIPRGIGALGYTIQRPTEDRFLMTQNEMENKMAVLLGGRAAEMIVFGRPSTGAADDLAKATDIARAVMMRYGMSEKLGLVAYEEERRNLLAGTPPLPTERRYSESTAREIDCAVREALDRAFVVATNALTRGRAVLERGAKQLLEKETLTEPELQSLRSDLLACLSRQ
jgi:cell division protease FtsH